MAVKIRLARRGRKNLPMYSILVADARAKRDGRFIEKIGTYNPNPQPAIIELKEERAIKWLLQGAQPTKTARNILSSQGIMLKKHLYLGVQKGAITQVVANQRFVSWQDKHKNKKRAFIQKEPIPSTTSGISVSPDHKPEAIVNAPKKEEVNKS